MENLMEILSSPLAKLTLDENGTTLTERIADFQQGYSLLALDGHMVIMALILMATVTFAIVQSQKAVAKA